MLMHNRWVKANLNLPVIDKKDIQTEQPMVNGGICWRMKQRRQHNAEYTQSSYENFRKMEEAYHIGNYMRPRNN